MDDEPDLWPYLYGFGVLCAIGWVLLIIFGWVFFARGVAQSSEKRLLSGLFALLGTFFAPFSTIPIVLNTY